MKYTPVIGLEVHVELKTNSKMFCSCSADYFGQEPNSHTCPVCLGLPGALPVPNKQAIDWCVEIGMALACEIPHFAKFDRKNYFYPDLAKGYQISQYDEPFCVNGFMIVKATPESKTLDKKIRIRRVHMEEDTGKLIHAEVNGKSVSLIDFNRSGVPLVEIVTEPDFDNAFQVTQYLQKLQQIVRYLDVSNADMEKGDMRLEPNISLRKERQAGLPNYKVEVKNINSFKFVKKSIEVEIARQAELLDEGKRPPQETRGWHEGKQTTVSQRLKEEANDYRYFPEPDIPPIRWNETKLKTIREQLPELPEEKMNRFVKSYGLSLYDAEILTREKETADYFEEGVKVSEKLKAKNEKTVDAKQIANWIINKKVDVQTTLPAKLVEMILAKTSTVEIDEAELNETINDILTENQQAVADFKNGKETVIMFLVGQTMRKLGKKVDVNIVKEKLLQKLR